MIDTLSKKTITYKTIENIYLISTAINTNKFIYLGNITHKITTLISKDKELTFWTENSIGMNIKSNNDKPKYHEKSGVYKLKCESYDKLYIG